MGNCQAIDNAALLVQHPSGRVDKLYCPVTATEIMNSNPGHYVALLLTTTYCPPPTKTATAPAVTATTAPSNNNNNSNNFPVRITRIKLLRPTDTLAFGHVYRLITTQELIKGLKAKKYAKMKQQYPELVEKLKNSTNKFENSDPKEVARRSLEKIQVKHDRRHQAGVVPPVNAAAARSSLRAWQPALQSISEAAGS